MTSERRWSVGLEDIKAISLVCNSCGVRLTFAPDDIQEIPMVCPNPRCNNEWQPTRVIGGITEANRPMQVRLLDLVCSIRKRKQQDKAEDPNTPKGFRLLFEFDEPN